MMSSVAQVSFKNLEKDAKWQGHFDEVSRNGAVFGWAFARRTPHEDLKLDLYVHGINLARTTTNQARSDIEKIFELEQGMNVGFEFNLKTFNPEGALELLRRFGLPLPDINVVEDVRVHILETEYTLPVRKRTVEQFLDLSGSLHYLIDAAARHLRWEIAAGLDIESLQPVDLDILLLSDPLFSSDWYRDTYAEVTTSNLGPVEHCRRFATSFQYDTGPWFDTVAYHNAVPEARDSRLAPSVHYAVNGHDTWWPGQGRFRDVLPRVPGRSDHAVLVHLHGLDTVADLQRFLASFPDETHVFISVPDDLPDHDPARIAKLFPRAREILTVSGNGQDVSAFLEVVQHVRKRGYAFFCKVHSKKGGIYPDVWRRTMFDALAATPERVAQTVESFHSDPRILMSGPAQFWLKEPDLEPDDRAWFEGVVKKTGYAGEVLTGGWAYFAGACFWIDARLAELIADASESFVEPDSIEPDGKSRAMESLFSFAAVSVGGRVALTDGCDWIADPVVLEKPVEAVLDRDEDTDRFLLRHLKDLSGPQIVEGTAGIPRTPDAGNGPGHTDTALHGTIDVVISCWAGRLEVLHDGLVELGRQLELNGLTWSAMVGSRPVEKAFLKASCRNVFFDSLYLRFPADHAVESMDFEESDLQEEFVLSLLRSEALFLKGDLAEGQKLQAAVSRVRRLHAYYRAFLMRHRVKMFLIWGTTAPKSRLFMHLCQELGIEYQIIERGHFPGTLSIDPMGQFGTGVRPRLIDQMSPHAALSDEANTRFNEIQSWYDMQQDNAAYADFQKRETKDVEMMQRARRYGRPVILVIGGNDQGGGVTRPDPDPLRVNWFGSSDNAFNIIRRLVSAKFPNAFLVLRPHPSQKPQEAEFVLVAHETALDNLIESADLCITIATTASAICLLKEKPLLTLGLSESSGRGVGETIIDETHLLAVLRRHIWADFANPYPNDANRNFIIQLFDYHLIGIDDSVPTRRDVADLARLIAGRHQRMKTGFLHDYVGQEEKISQAMFEDVRDRGRAIFPVDQRAFSNRTRPGISVVLPIYGDYEGTRICFNQLVRHQKENGFRVIMVWDRGPDLRLRDLCLEYADKAGFTYLENRENVGFSGTVNSGILHAGRDDIILLNSDTIPCGDWALRLQDAAYAHPKIAATVPFSNSATIYNVPFPNGKKLPEDDPIGWIEELDLRAKKHLPQVLEMPISHGFCTYVRRSTFDRLGTFSEMKFGKGHGEDNEFSMRIRSAGFFCGCATGVLIGHAGSTSFADDAMKWKLAGRKAMQDEFTHYFEEVRMFFQNDPLEQQRKNIALEEV